MRSSINPWFRAAAALALVAFCLRPAGAADASAAASPGPAGSALSGRAPVRWESDLAAALGLAQVSLKPVLVLFVAPRNVDCDRIKSGVLPDDRVQAWLARFECVEIDAALRNELAMQYRVRLAPSFRVLEPDGRLKYGLDGYQSASDLVEALESFQKGLSGGPELTALAERIKGGRVDAAGWASAMGMMSEAQGKAIIRQAVLMTATNARSPLVACLTNSHLSVRSGALDLLEELAGDTMGFDPFISLDAPESEAALARWRNWAASTNTEGVIYSILTEEEFNRGLQDLIGRDPARSARALRLLGQGGETVARGIVAYLEAHPDLEEGSRRRIKEVQYAAAIPAESRLNPAATAHRLIWGNQDVQLQTIRQLSDCGLRGMPILADLLKAPDPVIREAAVESAFAAAGRFAVKPLQAHLDKEQDPDVMYAILRQFGKISTRRSLMTLERFFTHENEELAVVAIEGAAKHKLGVEEAKVLPLLKDPRWRVRVAALQSLKSGSRSSENKEKPEAVKLLLNDPDPFVRHTAVTVLVKLGYGAAETELKDLYRRYPDMRGLVVSSLLALNKPVPGEFQDELIDRDPGAALQALDGMGTVNAVARPFLHRAANSANADVACAALGVLARSESRTGADVAVLSQVLRGGKQEQVLTVLQEYDVGYRQRAILRESLKENGEGALRSGGEAEGAKAEAFLAALAPRAKGLPAGGAGTTGELDLLRAVARVMGQSSSSDSVRRSAMLLLCQYGHDGALRTANEMWGKLTLDEQASVAYQLDSGGDAVIPLFRKALASPAEEVWQRALSQLSSEGANRLVPEFLDRLLASPPALKAADIWDSGVNDLCAKKPELLLPRLRPLLEEGWEKNDLLILALAAVAASGKPGDLPLALSRTTHDDPFVRRAAWLAVAACGPDTLAERVGAIRKDPSWHVREMLPAWVMARQNRDKFEMYFSADKVYERYDGLDLDPRYEQTSWKMKPALIPGLRQMAVEDADPYIRFRCSLALLGGGIPLDLNHVYEAGRSTPNKKAVASALRSFLSENESKLGRGFARLLPLLRVDGEEEDDSSVARLRSRWEIEESEGDEVELSFVFASRPVPSAKPLLASLETKDSGQAGPLSRNEPILLVFFTTPGCKSCGAVEKTFQELMIQYPKLKVLKHNIKTAEGLQLNEVLCQQFGVSSRNRGVTPAVFAARGSLVKLELTRNTLADLVEKSYRDPEAGAWLRVTDDEKKAAQEAIDQRWRSFTVPLVMGGGLADGVNPCAFATILFLISYLRVRRRSSREIVWIGSVYVAAVFLTYFSVGVGLTSLVEKLGEFAWLRNWINGVLAAALLVVAVLSARDGVLCLKGRGGDMTLQLPDSMKKGIHAVVRKGTASPRYVLAAAVLGVAVSLLELACTGQVYLPTIVYMVQVNTERAQAILLLALYNLAFVAPLVAVFALAALGMGSDRLQAFMVRHMALVKFVLALVFILLFAVFVRFGFG
jgi:cytochrome c biogenesis protein CcdA/HEAT repeat protein